MTKAAAIIARANQFSNYDWAFEAFRHEGDELLLEARRRRDDGIWERTAATLHFIGVISMRLDTLSIANVSTINVEVSQGHLVVRIVSKNGQFEIICVDVHFIPGKAFRAEASGEKEFMPSWGPISSNFRCDSTDELIGYLSPAHFDKFVLWEHISNHSGTVFVGLKSNCLYALCLSSAFYLDLQIKLDNVKMEAANVSDEIIIEERLDNGNLLVAKKMGVKNVLRLRTTNGIHYISALNFACAPFNALDIEALRLDSAASFLFRD